MVSWRAQQAPAKVFPKGGEVGWGLCVSGIHRISRLASVSRCAVVSDEYDVSIRQRSQNLSHKDFHVYQHMVLILFALSWTVYCPTLAREVPIRFKCIITHGNIECIETESLDVEV